jgi:hypothetical protein
MSSLKATQKASREEVERRVQIVCQHLIRCDPIWEILRSIEREWGISHRQAKRYLEKARKAIREDFEADALQLRSEQFAVADRLKTELWRQGKFLAVLKVLEFQAKLAGTTFGLNDHLRAVLEAGYEVRMP